MAALISCFDPEYEHPNTAPACQTRAEVAHSCKTAIACRCKARCQYKARCQGMYCLPCLPIQEEPPALPPPPISIAQHPAAQNGAAPLRCACDGDRTFAMPRLHLGHASIFAADDAGWICLLSTACPVLSCQALQRVRRCGSCRVSIRCLIQSSLL